MAHPTVLLGMSGGVDSSVAASLLVRQGYEVHGITLQVWEHEDETVATSKKWQERSCCKVGIAKHVAKLLNISHEVIDTRDTFQKGVIDDFLRGYTTGTTPNPCVRCNERVKLRGLIDLAAARNINYVATGHYARLQNYQGTPVLARATDDRKDQTYFLYRLNPHWLPKLLFPLGHLRKPDVWERGGGLGAPSRRAGRKVRRSVLSPKETTVHLSRRSFPRPKNQASLSMRRGSPWANTTELRSTHRANAEALGIATGQRLYVQQVRPATNTVVLGPEESLRRHECTVSDLNLFTPQLLERSAEVQVKVRYATPPTPAILSPLNPSSLRIQFQVPQRALSPGQSAVFYEGDHVLGGGIIQPF